MSDGDAQYIRNGRGARVAFCTHPIAIAVDLSAYTLPWSDVDWCKFFKHLRRLTVRHFGRVEAMGSERMAPRSSSRT
jgi:hypothetical protein